MIATTLIFTFVYGFFFLPLQDETGHWDLQTEPYVKDSAEGQ